VKYLLDTDSVSFALRGVGEVGARLRATRPSEVAISAITLAELRFGADRKGSRKLHALIDTFARAVAVAPFDEDGARAFGHVGSLLAERGTPIGEMDTLIAAHAVALKMTLVTNNVRHFSRVPGLSVENWGLG
jgi:tRNA(fMet)-specific endonuclease VapC